MSDDKATEHPYSPGWTAASEPVPHRRPSILRKLQRWSKRHPVLDGMTLGPMVLLGLLVWRSLGAVDLSVATCLLIALVATALGACAGLNNRRRNRQRAERGEPDSPLVVFLGLSETEPRPPLARRIILPTICATALLVGVLSALIINDVPRG